VSGFDVRRVDYLHPDAVLMVEAVQAEYVRRYGGRDETPLDPAAFEPPEGAFFVGYLGDEPVATAAWRRSDVEALGATRTAEIKRMYVAPVARGRGLARQLLAHVEADAAAHGFEALVLETGTKQPEAMSLYESSGYTRIPGFGFYRDQPLSRCYARRVVALTPGRRDLPV
jgi:GNAT superfamily N-acetyltransferase